MGLARIIHVSPSAQHEGDFAPGPTRVVNPDGRTGIHTRSDLFESRERLIALTQACRCVR
jgi:hypothetical protein